MYSEVAEDYDASPNEVEQNFIDKVLGEMKNKFNKPEIESEQESHNVNNDKSSAEDPTKALGISLESVEETSNKSDTVSDPKNVNGEATSIEINEEIPKDKSNASSISKLPDQDKPVNTKRRLRTKQMEKQDVANASRFKRSSLRRGRDYNESVLQSAIARKEKSYNESSKPQRLVRKLKPTPKAIENMIKTKSKSKMENGLQDKRTDNKTGSAPKRRNRNEMNNKITKKSKDSEDSKKSREIDDHKKTKDMDENNIKEEKCRRSQRISKEEFSASDKSNDVPDNKDCIPLETKKAIVKAEAVTNKQSCLCNEITNIFVGTEYYEKESRFCCGLDSFDGKVLGCSRPIKPNQFCLVRPSTRIPYLNLCQLHLNRLLRHHCCPTCGLFCTQGVFYQCSQMHLYHINCRKKINNDFCCPHCGNSGECNKIKMKFNTNVKYSLLHTQKV